MTKLNNAQPLCKFNGLIDRSNGKLWVVGTAEQGSKNKVLIFDGNLSDSDVKSGYAKHTGTRYFDVRLMRLERFLSKKPNWAS